MDPILLKNDNNLGDLGSPEALRHLSQQQWPKSCFSFSLNLSDLGIRPVARLQIQQNLARKPFQKRVFFRIVSDMNFSSIILAGTGFCRKVLCSTSVVEFCTTSVVEFCTSSIRLQGALLDLCRRLPRSDG